MVVGKEDRRTVDAAERNALGALINIAGRQRMLSHRAVMLLALSGQAGARGGEMLLEQAGAALAGYETGVHLLLHGDPEQSLPPLFSERVRVLLQAAIPGHGAGATVLRAFGARGLALLAHMRETAEDCGGEVCALADLAGTVLLPLLNEVVRAFEHDLADALRDEAARAADLRTVMADALSDIEQTASRIQLIGFNALIEAARAGDAGRAFSVIAEEIKDLGAQTREESAKMQAAMARLFAA